MSDIDPKAIMAMLGKIIAANPADALAAIATPDGRTIAQKLTDLPDDLKFAIGSITLGKDGTKIAMVNKSAAIELAARCLGMVTDHTILEDQRKPPVEPLPADATLQQAADYYRDMIEGPRH